MHPAPVLGKDLQYYTWYLGAITTFHIITVIALKSILIFKENAMPSDKPQILIRTDKELITKLDIIAKKQNRSRANLAETILKEYVEQYEQEQGRVNSAELSKCKTG